jgi:CheY-like chemotaxis protein
MRDNSCITNREKGQGKDENGNTRRNALMQKILISNDLKPQLTQAESFLRRTDISVLFASTNDELLKIHIEENVNLIVTRLDMPGHRSEEIFDIIRQSRKLRDVLTIIVSDDDVKNLERCRRCGAGAVLTMPVDPVQLTLKAQEFLNVAPRQSYRVLLNVTVEGKFKSRPFLCRTENISTTGMLIRTDLDLARNDVMSCSFYLPDGTKVAASGEVVRTVHPSAESAEKLYGINYTTIGPGVKSAIEAFVERELRYKE